MTSGELAKELMYYGVSAISLVTTGSIRKDCARVPLSLKTTNMLNWMKE